MSHKTKKASIFKGFQPIHIGEETTTTKALSCKADNKLLLSFILYLHMNVKNMGTQLHVWCTT